MDLAIKYQMTVLISLLFIGYSNTTAWSRDFKQEDLDQKAAFILDKQFVRSISKRSPDWSNRQPESLVSSVEYKLDAQESDIVDSTTKLPKIVRKIRFQNVPQQIRHFEKNGNSVEKYGNDTITSDKQGRVVRIRKFRKKKTTEKPMVRTVATSTTTTMLPTTFRTNEPKVVQPFRNPNSITTAIPLLFKSVTPQMTQYAHITVINKEIIDQKPNRKQKNKKQTRVPSSETFEDNDPYLDLKVQSTDRTYNSVPNQSRGYRSSEDLMKRDSAALKADDVIIKTTKHEEGNSKLNTRRRDAKVLPVTPKSREDTAELKPKITLPKVRNPARDVKRLKPQLLKNLSHSIETTSTTQVPKSVEVLSDKMPTQPSTTLQDMNNSKQSDDYRVEEDATTQAPLNSDMNLGTIVPETEREFVPMIPNNGFRRFPQQAFQGYPYEPMNPFLRPPGGQVPLRMEQPQNGGSLSPLSFQQPFPQFYSQNEPQFPAYYAAPQRIPPYLRSGSLGMPGFYPSPQLESIRRSIMDSYAEEESIESTTEYSLPKFEIPSIDFNDKGCRTVYKEVSAAPVDGSNQRTIDNRAKSFVMTRECFFPEGVPTTRSVDVKELIGDTTQPNK